MMLDISMGSCRISSCVLRLNESYWEENVSSVQLSMGRRRERTRKSGWVCVWYFVKDLCVVREKDSKERELEG